MAVALAPNHTAGLESIDHEFSEKIRTAPPLLRTYVLQILPMHVSMMLVSIMRIHDARVSRFDTFVSLKNSWAVFLLVIVS